MVGLEDQGTHFFPIVLAPEVRRAFEIIGLDKYLLAEMN
jgi:hypothetical protein